MGRGKGDESIKPKNVDGALQDEDAFVLGDDEDSENEVADSAPLCTLPPQSEAPPPKSINLPGTGMGGDPNIQDTAVVYDVSTPLKYYIKAGDTLRGVALRFGINVCLPFSLFLTIDTHSFLGIYYTQGRELCRLNKLPSSTLTTTPHILHTRTYLILPLSAQGKVEGSQSQSDTTEDKERETRRARERAEKRLQTLTKEVDWRIAKAYVALADDPAEVENDDYKVKEHSTASAGPAVVGLSRQETIAMNHYLDDDEWEARENRQGRTATLTPFPCFSRKHEIKGTTN
jgi:hypothetical protein